MNKPTPNMLVSGICLQLDLANDREIIELNAQEIAEIVISCTRNVSATEDGWLIESASSSPAEPDYFAGFAVRDTPAIPNVFHSHWTKDHMLAIRFARKEDAERVAASMDDPSCFRICEHEWGLTMMPKRNAKSG